MADADWRALFRPLPQTEDEVAALIALASLAGMTPRRLWRLLAADEPTKAWRQVLNAKIAPSGRAGDPSPGWTAQARLFSPAQRLHAHRQLGVSVDVFGGSTYPVRLRDDPYPPPVLFRLGSDGPLDRTAIAVVGTRRCTRYGRDVAHELGASLASADIDVVSGLARGIDAAGHAGALQTNPARTIAVVASGLDIVYPRGNRDLWHQVARHGRLLSEWPLGSPALKWRFPARNRLIAALSVAVVVIESAQTGGSMHTVDEAITRARPVFAVPGSIRSTASNGTHRLIADGAQILSSIEEFVATIAPNPRSARCVPATETPDLTTNAADNTDDGSWLLEWLGFTGATADAIVAGTGRSPAEVMLEIERQISAGRVARTGSMIERIR